MPLVSRTFDQLIDFTRTSAATYVDASGRIVPTPASRNLLTFTQEFDNAVWGKVAATVTANAATAPDGTLTADTLVATAGASTHNVSQAVSTSGSPVTFSIYAKAGTHSFIQLMHTNVNSVNFNLSTGTVGTVPSGMAASMTAVGNGFYRCTVSMTPPSAGSIRVAMVSSISAAFNESWTAAGTETVFLWGAQLEAVPDANLTLGSEVVTVNSATLTGATGYTAITGSAVVALAEYLVTYTCTLSAGTIQAVVGGTALASVSASGTYRAIVTAGATTAPQFYSSGGVGSISNFSVKQITGTTGMPTDYTRNNGGVYPPRFDYDPVTLAPKGLLVEEQRTNLLLRSEQFDNAAWAKSNVTVTSNAIISPDGTADADKIVDNTANTSHAPYTFSLSLSATTYTNSVYLKAAERSWAKVTIYDGASEKGAFFNLATGALGNVDAGATASIQSVGNGWYRCIVTVTTAAGSGGVAYYIATGNGTGVPSYTGDGTSGLYIWGAQLEAGSFATSYIPTVASQVTRTADSVQIQAPNFASWYNQSAGTFLFEGSTFNVSGFAYATLANDTSNNNRFGIYRSGAAVSGFISTGGVTQMDISASSVAANTPFKMAVAAQTNSGNFSFNGNIGSDDTSITMPAVTRFDIGCFGSNNQINGHIRSIRYYPTRLQNSQLQALTA